MKSSKDGASVRGEASGGTPLILRAALATNRPTDELEMTHGLLVTAALP
jgi:hypothetical protein